MITSYDNHQPKRQRASVAITYQKLHQLLNLPADVEIINIVKNEKREIAELILSGPEGSVPLTVAEGQEIPQVSLTTKLV